MALWYRATVVVGNVVGNVVADASEVGVANAADAADVAVASEVVFSTAYDTVLTARYAAEAMLIATTKCH